MWLVMAACQALAGGWSAGELVPIAVDGPVTAVRLGSWSGEPALFLTDGQTVTVVQDGAAMASSEHEVADLRFADFDGDGEGELVVCGPQGLAVLRGGEQGFAEPLPLSDRPCERMVSFDGGVLTWTGEVVMRWTSGDDGLVGDAVPQADASIGLASRGDLLIAVGESRAEGPAEGPTLYPVGTDVVVGVSADTEGWAIVYGGENPQVVRGDGQSVPLPLPPEWVEPVMLGGMHGFVVGLGGGTVALGIGAGPIRIVDLPIPAGRVGGGDLDGDGCLDLAVVTPDGSAGGVLQGVCDAALLTASEEPVDPMTLPIELGGAWQTRTLLVGQMMDAPLIDVQNGWIDFAHKGGPKTLHAIDGRLRYQAQASDLGMWRVSIRMAAPGNERWSGLILRVKSNGDPRADAKALGLPEPAEVVVSHAEPDPEPKKGLLGFRECLVGAGLAVGLSKNAQQEWSNVGLPDAVPSASPAVTMVCSGGAPKVRWFLGADSAPTFFYLAPRGRMNHILAGTLGVEWRPGALRVGPFVNAGLVVFGVGLRTVFMPFETKRGARHGLETRLTAYPSNLSGQALLAYTWEFGEF